VGDECAAVYDEQIIARSRRKSPAATIFMVSSVLFFENRQTAPVPKCELRKNKGSRQFDDVGAAFPRRTSAPLGPGQRWRKKRAAVSGGF
jgi:hypothetical protein